MPAFLSLKQWGGGATTFQLLPPSLNHDPSPHAKQHKHHHCRYLNTMTTSNPSHLSPCPYSRQSYCDERAKGGESRNPRSRKIRRVEAGQLHQGRDFLPRCPCFFTTHPFLTFVSAEESAAVVLYSEWSLTSHDHNHLQESSEREGSRPSVHHATGKKECA